MFDILKTFFCIVLFRYQYLDVLQILFLPACLTDREGDRAKAGRGRGAAQPRDEAQAARLRLAPKPGQKRVQIRARES